jgi:Ser-tRNA(Ala) deacylase AlaX
MSKLVAIKIDVSKIDKARLYQGAKGQYLDATVFLNEEQGQYGDNGMITQSVSKEERESGVKGNILGNVKILGEFGDNKGGASAPSSQAPAPMDDIPFAPVDLI